VQGVALDAWFPSSMGDEALRVVRPGGRIVGPTAFGPLSQAAVLAHDENYWVAEKPAEVVALRRARLSE
jgi:hypothetical protein